MERKFIPSCRRGSSPTLTRCSKRSRRSCEGLVCGRRAWGFPVSLLKGDFEFQHRTSNIEHRTSNERCRSAFNFGIRPVDVGCWMLTVGCFPSGSYPPRRVMGAWWPSRSSKPLSARSTGRGTFDSYPLRQINIRFTIYDLRFGACSAIAGSVNRKSQIANRKSLERR